jgi:hypothetical protein
MASVLVAQLCFHYRWYYSPKFHHDFSTTIITSNNNSSNGSKSVGGLGILMSQPLEVVVLAFPLVDETPWNWKLKIEFFFWNFEFWIENFEIETISISIFWLKFLKKFQQFLEILLQKIAIISLKSCKEITKGSI